jgi:hypothetical protein
VSSGELVRAPGDWQVDQKILTGVPSSITGAVRSLIGELGRLVVRGASPPNTLDEQAPVLRAICRPVGTYSTASQCSCRAAAPSSFTSQAAGQLARELDP